MRRYIVLIIVILLVVSGGLAVWKVIQPKPNLVLNVAPDVATIKLDDADTLSPGKQHLEPGSHTIKVSFDGFDTKIIDFKVQADKVTSLDVVLNPNSQAGYDWLAEHPEQQALREQLGGKGFEAQSRQLAKDTPLIKQLPYIDRLFRVDYGQSIAYPNDPDKVAIYIGFSSDEGKQQSLQWIKDQGYDPSSLEIVYKSQNAE